MSHKKLFFGMSIVAVAVMLVASPVAAEAKKGLEAILVPGEENLDSVVVNHKKIKEKGAYGYGIVSSQGLAGVLVSTTHGGIQDSAAQTDASDASFHNHYVALTDDGDDSNACPGAEVLDITWDAPGSVTIIDKTAVISGPTEFSSTHSLTGAPLSYANDGSVGAVVSFTIDPVDANGKTIKDVADLAAVCINDIEFANLS